MLAVNAMTLRKIKIQYNFNYDGGNDKIFFDNPNDPHPNKNSVHKLELMAEKINDVCKEIKNESDKNRAGQEEKTDDKKEDGRYGWTNFNDAREAKQKREKDGEQKNR